MAKVESVESVEAYQRILTEVGSSLVVVHFSAEWAPQCKQMNDVMSELAKDAQLINVRFLILEAESLPELSEKYEIAAVPTFIFIKSTKKVDKLDGANVPELTKKVKHHALNVTSTFPPADSNQKEQDLNSRLKAVINRAPVMVFMKGNPLEPLCGFSKTLVQLLNDNNVKFDSFDILSDDEVRQGLKSYSDWPTYPQLYANGELLGGLDIIKELVESGELQSQLPKQQSLDERLNCLLNQSKVKLFIKGDPSTPRCGFSKTIVGILNDVGVKYDTFDILQDEEVRQGLKKYSNWPTYPQLYVNGELVGGLDIVKELQESGELESTLKGE